MISENDVEIITNGIEKKREDKKKKLELKSNLFVSGISFVESLFLILIGVFSAFLTNTYSVSIIVFITGVGCGIGSIYLYMTPEIDAEKEEKKKDREILRSMGNKTKILKQNP